MLDLDSAIRERHSTRMFLPQPVPRTLVDEALALAQWAPSNSNIQPWRVVFVTGGGPWSPEGRPVQSSRPRGAAHPPVANGVRALPL